MTTSSAGFLPAFDARSLHERLSRMSPKQQLVFGAAICERLIPSYAMFVSEEAWGDVHKPRGALDAVWEEIESRSVERLVLRKINAECEAAAPASEKFRSLFVTAAQDCCFSICSLLDFLENRQTERIVQVATYATDSVDLYVQEIESLEPNDRLLETKITEHPLMQRELQRQHDDLLLLETAVESEAFDQLKRKYRNLGALMSST